MMLLMVNECHWVIKIKELMEMTSFNVFYSCLKIRLLNLVRMKMYYHHKRTTFTKVVRYPAPALQFI